jgi:hypothetical protein
MLALRFRLGLPTLTRPLSSSAIKRSDAFSRPGPPPLPAADQAEFERLVKAAEVAPTVDSAAELAAEDLEHPDARKGPKPEFEGDVNPKTGEVGGPKRDPFIAGNADWQFGGRVTVSVLLCIWHVADGSGLLDCCVSLYPFTYTHIWRRTRGGAPHVIPWHCTTPIL